MANASVMAAHVQYAGLTMERRRLDVVHHHPRRQPPLALSLHCPDWDGAHWLWDDGAAYFGQAGHEPVEILDFDHVAGHLAAVALAARGERTLGVRHRSGQWDQLRATGIPRAAA